MPSIAPMIRGTEVFKQECATLGIGSCPLVAGDEAHELFGHTAVEVKTGREGWEGDRDAVGVLPVAPRMGLEVGDRRSDEGDTEADKHDPIKWFHNSHQ